MWYIADQIEYPILSNPTSYCKPYRYSVIRCKRMKSNNLPGSQLRSRWNTSFDKQTTPSRSQRECHWSSDTRIEKTIFMSNFVWKTTLIYFKFVHTWMTTFTSKCVWKTPLIFTLKFVWKNNTHLIQYLYEYISLQVYVFRINYINIS